MTRMRQGGEAQFQQQVEQLAKTYGWLTFHPADNRPGRNGRVQRVTAGFPDLVLVRAPEVIFAELKTEKGRVRADQQTWLAELEAVSAEAQQVTAAAAGAGHHTLFAIEAHIWRPSDFDVLHARLARGRRRHAVLYRQEADAA